jgi:hypothetical protein
LLLVATNLGALSVVTCDDAENKLAAFGWGSNSYVSRDIVEIGITVRFLFFR